MATTDISQFLIPAAAVGMAWPSFGQQQEPKGDEYEEESETDDEGDEPDYKARWEASERKVKEVNAEAKRHRLKAKEYARQLRETSGEDNGYDAKQAQEERDALRVENAVLKVAMQHGVDPDLLELKLRKSGHLKLDEEGDLPIEFDEAAEQIAKKLQDRGRASGPRPPKSPKLSEKKSGSSNDSDLAALAKRFPALTRRM